MNWFLFYSRKHLLAVQSKFAHMLPWAGNDNTELLPWADTEKNETFPKAKNFLKFRPVFLKTQNIPCSRYEYDVPSIKAKFVCRQTSPFLPGDYKDSAMPISLFDWRVINYGQEEYSVSIGFTFKNGWAGKTDTTRVISTEDLIDEAFVGRKISQTFRGEELHYGVAVERSDGVRAENLDDFRPYTQWVT